MKTARRTGNRLKGRIVLAYRRAGAFLRGPESQRGQGQSVDAGTIVFWVAIIGAIIWAIARDQLVAFFSRVFGSL